MAEPQYIDASVRFSIAPESDSGTWVLILHIEMLGKTDHIPMFWYSSKADAERVLAEIRNA